MENELRKQKLSKLALINEQLVSLLPNSFSSKAKLIDWLNSNPYSPYITLYGGENALLYNQEKSFISPTDGKNRFILEDEFSFKLENFTSFDNQILSANEPLSKIINCKQLFKNYPEFQNLEININISNANNGYFSGNTLYSNNKANKINIFASNNKEAMRVLLHELQHCIQLKEGFKIGTSYYNEHGVMDLFVGLNKTQSIDEIKNTLSKDTMFNDEVLFKEVFENHQYFNENKDGLKAKLIYIDPYDYIEAVNKVKPTHKHSEDKLQSLKNAYDNGIKVPVPYLAYGSRDEANSDFGQEGYNRAVHATYIGRRTIPVFVRYRENDENIPQAIKNAIDFEKSSFSDISTKKSMVEIDSSKATINMDILNPFDRMNKLRKQTLVEDNGKSVYKYIVPEENKKEYEYLEDIAYSSKRRLGDVLKHDTLYTKYPALYDLKVNVLNIDSHAAYGKNEITISQNLIDKGNIEEIKSSLIHEIQHAIQNIEGWARGGSPDEFANNKELKKLLQEQQEELKKSLGYNNWEYKILLEDYDKYVQLLEKGKNNYSVKPFYEEFVKEKNLKEDIAQYFVNKMLYFDNEISSLNSSDNPYDSYQRLWGEQQARAVQYRMNMTDKERAKESWTNTLEQKEGQYGKPIVKYSNEENQLKAEKENTSRLKEWHKDSHSLTKNENGTPKIFYHGTRADSFDVFDISKPLYGEQAEGAYFSSSKSNAKKYGDKIYAVYLKFENPLVIDAYGQNYNDIADSINHQSKWAKEDGYDSVIIKNIKDAPNGKGGVIQDTLIAFEPTQIKSVNNQIFNENNPNIMMNQSMSLSNLLENDIVNQNKIREIELKALLSKDKLEEYITLSDEKKIISILENIIVTDITNNNLQKEFYKTFGKDISNLKDIHIDTKKEIISSLSSYENYVDLKQSKLHCDALLNILNKDYDELVNKISTYKDWDFLANTEYSLSNYLSSVQGKESLLFIDSNGDEIAIYDTNLVNQNLIEEKINRIENLQEWHKNSSNLTKNKDGSPKVFYHGTKSSFNEFKENKIGESYGNQFGKGFYFTDNSEKANGYGYGEGGNVMPVYLNIQKIADFNDMNQEDLQKFKQELNKVIDINKDAGYGSVRKIDITEYPKEKQYELHDELIEKTDKYWHDRAKVKVIKEDGKIYLSYMEANLENVDGKDILGLLMHKQMLSLVNYLGFDGIKIGDEFIVFKPTQIKSVFNKGTFDKDNPNILEKNDLGLRNLEMIMSIIPNNMNMDTVKDYLFFNNITHEQLRGTIYNDILNSPKFDASKIRIPNTNSIDFDTAYFQSAGEKESREIESLYIHQDLNNLLAP